jgi:hypothetical protein
MRCGTVLGLLTVTAETVRNGEHRNKGLYVRYTILRQLELAQGLGVLSHFWYLNPNSFKISRT